VETGFRKGFLDDFEMRGLFGKRIKSRVGLASAQMFLPEKERQKSGTFLRHLQQLLFGAYIWAKEG
jgi:hypothetical protein